MGAFAIASSLACSVCVAHIWAAVPGSTDSCSKEELWAEADGLRLRPLASEVCVLGMPKAIQALCIHVAFLSSSYSPPLCVVFFFVFGCPVLTHLHKGLSK